MPARPPAGHGDAAWYDDAAGPVVRPYALTGGRTDYDAEVLDMVALILTEEEPPEEEKAMVLGKEVS